MHNCIYIKTFHHIREMIFDSVHISRKILNVEYIIWELRNALGHILLYLRPITTIIEIYRHLVEIYLIAWKQNRWIWSFWLSFHPFLGFLSSYRSSGRKWAIFYHHQIFWLAFHWVLQRLLVEHDLDKLSKIDYLVLRKYFEK